MKNDEVCLPKTHHLIDQQKAETAAVIFAALADPSRVTILKLLSDQQGELCVCDITANFALGQPTISHHLKILRDAGLVSTSKRGKWVYYALVPQWIEGVKALLATTLGDAVPCQPEKKLSRSVSCLCQ